MNTKHVEDTEERKKLKRAARKKAAPKAKRASGVARGSNKKKVKKIVKGQRVSGRFPPEFVVTGAGRKLPPV